jgi:hypothetical protein
VIHALPFIEPRFRFLWEKISISFFKRIANRLLEEEDNCVGPIIDTHMGSLPLLRGTCVSNEEETCSSMWGDMLSNVELLHWWHVPLSSSMSYKMHLKLCLLIALHALAISFIGKQTFSCLACIGLFACQEASWTKNTLLTTLWVTTNILSFNALYVTTINIIPSQSPLLNPTSFISLPHMRTPPLIFNFSPNPHQQALHVHFSFNPSSIEHGKPIFYFDSSISSLVTNSIALKSSNLHSFITHGCMCKYMFSFMYLSVGKPR